MEDRALSNDLLFFLSYARRDDEYGNMRPVQKFFNDLRDHVALLEGVDRQKVGYMDQRALEPGDEWPNDLAAALGKCCTFVAVMSPTYFQREYCGKEWYLFEQRSKALKKIIPVPWMKPVEGDFPEFATDLHVDFNIEDVPEEQKNYVNDYGDKGLRHIIVREKSTHGNAYNTVIEKLAARIIRAAKNEPLEPLAGQITDLKSALPKFPKKKDQPAQPDTSDVGGGWARFVIVAGTRPQMEGIRAQANVFYPQSDPRLWTPFAPEDTHNVGVLAAREAADLELIPMFASRDQQIVEFIRDAEKKKCVAIVVVDPWTLRLPNYADLLKDFDEHQFGNCSVIVAWNLADRLTQEKRQELRDELDAIFSRRLLNWNPIFFKDSVTNLPELRSAIRDALKEINQLLASHRMPKRPVGESAFDRRPGITSARTSQ